MATKVKGSSVVGKEKKALSSSSNSSSTNKKKPTKTIEKPASNPEKQVPNYLRPTKSSRVAAATTIANKPIVNRRRSYDNPITASGVQKLSQSSPSRQPLVSVGPRERKTVVKSAVGPVKSTIRSQSISEKKTSSSSSSSSRATKDGKTHPVVVATKASKGLKKSVSSCISSSSTAKKVTKDDAKSAPAAERTEDLSDAVEAEPEVKEAIDEEVVKLESEEDDRAVENSVSDEVEHAHDHEENGEKTEEGDQGQVDEEDEKVIPTVSEEQEEAAKEEKIIIEDKNNKTEEEERNSSSNESQPELLNHQSTTEEEKEEEKKEETEQGSGDVAEAEQKSSELNGNNREEEVKEEGVNEVVQSEQQAEKVLEVEVKEEEKEESNKNNNDNKDNKGMQGRGAVMMHGKKEAQVSNGVIEETTSKLLQEERRNKVRAMAGAFQSVIDHQAK